MSIFFRSYIDSDLFGKLIFLMLFILSVVSWTVLIRKIALLKQIKSKRKEIIEKTNNTNLRSLLFQNKHPSLHNPFAKILNAISGKTSQILNKNHHFKESKNVFLSSQDIRAIEEYSSITIHQEIRSLSNNLFILSTVVSLAPFLGILGTVWGILISLGELQKNGGGSNSIILGGLSTALATTVLGLLIAIPALIAYNYIKSLLYDIGTDLERFSHEILSEIELQYRNVEV